VLLVLALLVELVLLVELALLLVDVLLADVLLVVVLLVVVLLVVVLVLLVPPVPEPVLLELPLPVPPVPELVLVELLLPEEAAPPDEPVSFSAGSLPHAAPTAAQARSAWGQNEREAFFMVASLPLKGSAGALPAAC
jgi:hypothetical protein